jgi:glycosyltransferase involved in cell wall biosynthesis
MLPEVPPARDNWRPHGDAGGVTGRRLVLAVLADLPNPARSGNHLRDLQNLRLLRLLGYTVVVVAGVRTAGARDAGPAATVYQTVAIPNEHTSVRARLRRMARLLRAGGGPRQPGPWALAYEDAGLAPLVYEAIDALKPAAVFVRSTFAHLAPALRLRTPLLIFDAHDSEYLLARSLLPLSRARLWPAAVLRLLAARRVDRLLALGDEVWVPSMREADQLARYVPRERVIVVPNGVAVPDRVTFGRRKHELLLVAGFGYPPNEAAAVRLVEGVLPLVRERFPDTVATLVGRDLKEELAARWQRQAVHWLGVVDDLQPLYSRAAALVLAYVRSTETGTPLKVAEAIAHGLPVVATRNATAALGLIEGEHVLNGESDRELAEAVCQLLSDPIRSRDLAARAHGFARDTLAPKRLAERLRRESVLASRVPT